MTPNDRDASTPVIQTPQVAIPKLSALCSFGMTQLIMTGALKQILQQHFVDPDHMVHPSLRDSLRRESQRASDTPLVCVESLSRWRPELTGTRPGVVIKAGTWNYMRMGIGDSAGVDLRSGRRDFWGLWEGSHTLFALGNEGAETQILAAEVAKLMLWCGSLLSDQLNLQRFLITSIGELSALAESPEQYVVPVVLGYLAPEAWSQQSDAPRLKRIVFDANTILS